MYMYKYNDVMAAAYIYIYIYTYTNKHVSMQNTYCRTLDKCEKDRTGVR